jgi:hypothetical protein
MMPEPKAAHNKRMLSAWFFAALQTSRKCGRYTFKNIQAMELK